MAITFGQDLSRALGRTLDRRQQSQQFAQQLARRLEQDAFNRKIRNLSQQMQQKRLQLEGERIDNRIIQQGIQNQLEQERLDIARDREERLSQQQQQENSDEDSINQGAVSIELQSLTNELSKDRQQLQRLKQAQSQVFDTGTVPQEFSGEFQNPNPTNVLFSLTSSILDLQSQIDKKQQRAQQLKELAGTAVPDNQKAPESNEESTAPLDDL